MVQGLWKGPTLKVWYMVKGLHLHILIAGERISFLSTMSRPILEPTSGYNRLFSQGKVAEVC
jgi:hypothetical protein